ncbi:MAG: hypothetical protein RL266_426 [Bacteroidota bacterium]
MKQRKRLLVILSVVLCAYLLSLAQFDLSEASENDQARADSTYLGFALDTNDHFMAAGNCDGCHGFDQTGHASVDEQGNDISPVTLWRATMMANAARDPFFRAKVSHESAINPSHQAALEDKCNSCHAPLGRYSNHYYGYGPYSLADLEQDPMGQDGVSCMGCHKQTAEHLGSNHSGELYYDSVMREYGPYQKPLQGPMQGFVGVSPEYGEHVTESGLCAGCHSLITNSVDLNGNFTGTTFVEQATYHEWLNSEYSLPIGGSTCQSCHIPRTNTEVVIAAYYQLLAGRTPYGKHELVGGNTFMLKLMKTHREALDVRATEVHFDSTIARTLFNLQEKSVLMNLEHETTANDTAYFSVRFQNLTGHKFPSGFPSRRAYVEFVVTDQHNDTVFRSGLLNEDHYLPEEDASYEPHYNIINSEQQVQIYEMVMGDVNGNATTILERAVLPIKDNRLVPAGFSTSHPAYDTTLIAGNALQDEDFNFEGFEGSGSDIVHYHVPLHGSTDSLFATARMYYQSVPKKWVEEMFATSTPQIESFESMFNTADHTPVLVAANTIAVAVPTGVEETVTLLDIQLYPNPSNGTVWLKGQQLGAIQQIDVFGVGGKRVASLHGYPANGFQLPAKAGVYLVRIRTEDAEQVFRILRL